MDNPLISVIVPVYKVEKYLDRCVESIVNQTYTNLEIILVDDGSPDNCPAMCDDWAKKDSRIKVLHIENKGVANARNTALSVANGEFISFIDSDDWADLDMFETLYNIGTQLGADISICDYQINEESRSEAVKVEKLSKEDALIGVAEGGYKYGVLWNKLYKADIIKNIKMPSFVCSEDLVFNYYAFKRASIFAETDAKLYHYFQSVESTVHRKFSIGAFDAVKAKEIILENEKGTSIEKSAVRGLISSDYVVLSGCIQNDVFPEKQKKLIESIKKYRKQILFSNLYTTGDKIKTVILTVSPSLYRKLIKRKHT